MTNPLTGVVGLIYFPHPDMFIPVQASVYTTTSADVPNGGSPPPPENLRYILDGLFTGNFMAGHRPVSDINTAHTGVLLLDPNDEIRDLYRGNGQAVDTQPDVISLTDPFTPFMVPYYQVVFQSVTMVPRYGRRKVVVLDQIDLFLIDNDTFTDVNGTALGNHTPDRGSAWTILNGSPTIQGNRLQGDSVNYTIATKNAGKKDIIALLTVVVPSSSNIYSGIAIRHSNINNGWWALVDSGLAKIYENNAGVVTVRAQVAHTAPAGSSHTLHVSARLGTIRVFFYESGSLCRKCSYASANLNQGVTTHGVYLDASQLCDNYQTQDSETRAGA